MGKIVKAHGGLCIGSGPGALYDQKKFDTPYIRDFLLDRGVAGDVSETAAPWSQLTPVYDAVVAAAQEAFAQLGVMGCVMCHLSHSYHSGACLYFTFAFLPPGGDTLDRVRRGQVRDPADLRGQGRARCRTTTRSAPSTRGGWDRTSHSRAS